jgi:hypothetical protein
LLLLKGSTEKELERKTTVKKRQRHPERRSRAHLAKLGSHAVDDRINIDILVNGLKARVMIDSGADTTFISLRWINENNIGTRKKEFLRTIELGDGLLKNDGETKIYRETEIIHMLVNDIDDDLRMDVMELGNLDIIVGYDWLKRYNLMIDFITKEVTQRHLAWRIAGVRLLGHKVEQTRTSSSLRQISTKDMERLLRQRKLGDEVYAVTAGLKTTKEEKQPTAGEVPADYTEFLDVFKD